jgi:hypothetical protein
MTATLSAERRLAVCNHAGCHVLVERPQNTCPAHTPKRVRGEHHSLYSSKRWRRFRARILTQRLWCQHCLAKGLPTSLLGGCTPQTTGRSQHVHHKVDIADGGAPFDPDNVEALSHACHSRETNARQRRAAPRS